MQHTTVLLNETIDGLDIHPGEIVFDGTLGGGGHSAAICARFGANVTLLAADRDEGALELAKARLENYPCKKIFALKSFDEISSILETAPFQKISRAVLDLGISSIQLDTSGRGFSFLRDEPLLMTMNAHPEGKMITAYDVVNSWSEQTLSDIFSGFADEKFPKRIARHIVEARKLAPIKTTFQLADIVKEAIPAKFRNGKTHPATQVFLAIRMAVNGELQILERGLQNITDVLVPGGRLAVISFHSVEDRMVKNIFKKLVSEGSVVLVNKKPIVPSREEISSNPRSRSAKLRIVERI